MGERYVALIGDIRGSRQVEDRRGVQQRFREAIDGLDSALPADAVGSPATITTGDEFQVLLHRAQAAVEAISRVEDAMHPVHLRFGVGAGRLDTQLNEDAAIDMDGPCFHRAREALDEAKQRSGWVRVRGFGTLDADIGALFDVVAAVRSGWTDRQAEIARAVRATGVQKEVADAFDVSPSVVSESLKSAHAREVFAAETSLASMLEAAFARTDRRDSEGA